MKVYFIGSNTGLRCEVCGQAFEIDGSPDGEIYNSHPICEGCSSLFDDLDNITAEQITKMQDWHKSSQRPK